MHRFHKAEALSMTGDLRVAIASALGATLSSLRLFCGESENVDNIVTINGSLSIGVGISRIQ